MKVALKDPIYQGQVKASVVEAIFYFESVYFFYGQGQILEIN